MDGLIVNPSIFLLMRLLSFSFDKTFDACDDDADGGVIGDGFDCALVAVNQIT